MTREGWKQHCANRLKVVRLLKKDINTPNTELQKAYGEKLFSTAHMALLKQAVARGLEHPEHYGQKGLRERLDADLGKPATVRKLHPVPSAVDKLAGLKSFLDQTVLPGMLGFVVGSDVQTVVITVTTDPAGNPTLSRKIGRAVTEWDEHTLDPAKEVENG